MKPTQQLQQAGQSLWLDNITRDLLASGSLARQIDELSLSGLTSNPTIFDKAIGGSSAYDDQIRACVAAGRTGEPLFFDLALADITRAADLFRPVHERTAHVDGWVSLEVSPLLAHDGAARARHARAGRSNVRIKIPGTTEGLSAIEEATYEGIPVNVTLLFSVQQYRAAAEAYLRGVERRIAAGRNPHVASVASLFVSRWDAAVAGRVPATLANRLGIAVARRTYRTYVEWTDSDRWRRAMNAGARPQRLLFASTGTKDPAARDTLYVEALIAPLTVNTIPEKTLGAFADHGVVGAPVPHDGGDCEVVLAEFARAGIDVPALGERLQHEGAQAFVSSWQELLSVIATKSEPGR